MPGDKALENLKFYEMHRNSLKNKKMRTPLFQFLGVAVKTVQFVGNN